jgi:hypothetical protein
LVADSGSITAQGSQAEPVVFTSIHDDAYGGNSDAKSTKPASGDWEGIVIRSAIHCYFHLCQFRYGGGGTKPYTLCI